MNGVVRRDRREAVVNDKGLTSAPPYELCVPGASPNTGDFGLFRSLGVVCQGLDRRSHR
jgi:hypothetical protein